MKLLFLIALTATLAIGESHPSWWMYASPEATALVGIQWRNLRHSPFAEAVEAELSSTGPLAFPDLDCLKQAREIVLSAPPLLAAEAGSFPSATVKDQAQKLGLRRLVYRGVTLWLPDKASKLGVAQISEQILLVGTQSALTESIDRSLLETGRLYSQLLPRAARFSQTGDLWVVAAELPDPLASLFVPLDANATEFLGQISVRDGLVIEASFDAGSDRAAAAAAEELRKRALSYPAVAHGLETGTDHSRVTIALQASPEQLITALHPAPVLPTSGPPAAPVAAVPAAAVPAAAVLSQRASVASPAPRVVVPQSAAALQLPVVAPTDLTEPAQPVKFEVTHLEHQPQIIHIYGLEDGPREILLQP